MNKQRMFLAVAAIAGAIVWSGCSNNATEEEMNQLNQIQSDISALRSQITTKQQKGRLAETNRR